VVAFCLTILLTSQLGLWAGLATFAAIFSAYFAVQFVKLRRSFEPVEDNKDRS